MAVSIPDVGSRNDQPGECNFERRAEGHYRFHHGVLDSQNRSLVLSSSLLEDIGESTLPFGKRTGRDVGIREKVKQRESWNEDGCGPLLALVVAAQPCNIHANIWQYRRQER